MVVMVHPNLPDQPITVNDEAVGTYRGSGWMTKEEADEQKTAAKKVEPRIGSEKKGE